MAAATVLASSTALAEPVRLLVSIGTRDGLPAEQPLKFADNDAKSVRDVLVSLGGVKSENAFLVTDATRAKVYAAIDRARAEAQRHRPEEVTLLFYFSGHGDRDALHMSGDRVLIGDLSRKLDEVPAGLRIGVTDACRATRDKGFAADAPFTITATSMPQATGQVWLHASSDGEAAQESDDLQGAIFTHSWIAGLRGAADSNGDARVTLEESFAFAHSQTMIRSAQSSGVLQKPQAVVSLKEAAPVVLTQTAAHMATLSLPPARDTHFLVYSAGAKSVLSEVWGTPDRALVLRVPPGRYVVDRRLGSTGGIARIAVAENEERRIEDRDFTAVPLEALARKGEDPDRTLEPELAPRHHELGAGYDLGGSLRTGLVQGPRIGYAYAPSWYALTLGGGYDFTSRSLATRTEDLDSLYARAGLELRFPAGSLFTFRGGAGVRGGLTVQTITPTSGTPARDRAFALGPEITLGGRVHLGPTLYLDLGATGAVAFLQQDTAYVGITTVTAALTLGARF